MSGTIALALALAACAWRSRLLLAASVTAFLVGGQILAIANIRLYNPYNWLYDSPAVVVISQVGRFAWLALLAAEVAWSRPVRELRQVAAVDGAGNAAATMHVVWPLVWPILAGGAVLVMLLSLTEVPATLLVRPLRPPVLVVQLMTWIHNLRDDNMIEGALLLLILAMTLAVVAITLIGVGLRIARPAWRRSAICVGVFAGLLAVGGCGKSSNEPEAILGGVGTGPGQFVYPRAIAYSPAHNTMFVVDRMARVQHLDMDGQSLREWQMPQWQNGKPVGLSVGPDGNLYVPDTHYHRVMVYSADGKLLRQWGGRGTEPGQFIFPTDIAFDSSGFIYVGEYGDNDRIQVFDAQGRFIRQFGRFGDGPGEFSRPESLLIVGDLLYVTDACNHRIQVFRTDGSFVRSMGSVGSDLGQFRFPYGLDKDSRGRLVVAEFGNNRVQLIDPQTGKGLATWGRPGRAPGELAYPWAVTVDRNDRVFVVDSGNDRIQVFGF